jgi:hypothetical protein
MKNFPLTGRKVGAESQSLVSVPNKPGLNPKYLCSAYAVRTYVLMTAICPSNRDVKSGSPLDAFLYASSPHIHMRYTITQHLYSLV